MSSDVLPETAPSKATEQVVTPFTVAGGVDASGKVVAIDYEKLTRDFGATPLTKELIQRFERVTGTKAHRFMRRGMVISHRDLEVILNRYEKGQPFYLYTGRGPSSDSMHVGHATPFEFTKYLQEAFDCPLVIQLTDDEKFMHNDKMTEDDAEHYAHENAKDIIGLGFDLKKTFIFSDYNYIPSCKAFYRNITKMAKRISMAQIEGTFGFNRSNNIGEYFFCAIQSAPSFATSFPHIFGNDPLKSRGIPCLIPCAIDQDPYFRQTREHAEALKYRKPALIHSIFLPALQGPGSKMSASVDSSAIFLNDSPNQIKKKINRHAFSGGQDTLEKHRELGGRTAQDVPFQYLSFFLEDDEELERLREGYEKGDITAGEMKKRCIECIQEYVATFQERRVKVTDDTVAEYARPRSLEYSLNPNPIKVEEKEKSGKAAPVKKEMAREHAEDKEEKGHAKTMSIGRSKVEVEETSEKGANGEVKDHVKRMSMSKG
jgi:tryptophanyl-tRNA synthetase